MKENPLRMNKNEKIAIGVGVAAGLAAMIYYVTRPVAAATQTPPRVVVGNGTQGGGAFAPAVPGINQLNPPPLVPGA